MASGLRITFLVLVCAHLAFGAGGPQRRRVPVPARLAALRREFRGRSEADDQVREGRSLVNTFPFIGGDRGLPRARFFGEEPAGDIHHDHHDHHDHHGGDHHPHALALDVGGRGSRQRNNNNNNRDDDISLDIGSIAAAGERCIDKVIMVTETEYDTEIECKHSYDQKCHTTYTTDFEPQQEEVCEENFIKECFIEYKKQASEEKVEFCHTPLVCEGEGPTECRTVYTSRCETRYHEHEVDDDIVSCETVYEEKCEDVTQGYTTEEKCTKWPKEECTQTTETVLKYSPETVCKKEPEELCGPSQCLLQPGPEQCFDKSETVITEVPEETCNLEPQKSCKHVTKLVPLLKPAEECVDIPKEVCSRSRTNPRTVQKPVVKKWCYVPSAESGLRN